MNRFVSRAIAPLLLGLIPAFASAQNATTGVDWLTRGAASFQSQARAIDIDRPASRRYAVVVGNGDYETAPDLVNAVADAKAMATFLRGHGFSVEERYDLTKRGFEDLMRRVLFEIGPDADVLFYFSGHGIQIGRRNYLLPVDAGLKSAYDTPFETVTLDSIIQILGSRSRQQLVILDSCRNNPFTDAKMMTEIDPTLFEAQTGFNAMSVPVNSLLAYATSPGAVAYDGTDVNSPFTGSLLQNASADPSQDMRTILKQVRRDVYLKTEGQQVPWESSTLVEPFVFGMTGAPTQSVQPYGESRGLQKIVAEFAPAAQLANAAASGQPMTISARLERRIQLGDALISALGLAANENIAISGDLATGRLILETAADGITDYAGQALSGDALKSLVYEYVPEQRPGDSDTAADPIVETFTTTRNEAETQGFALSMNPDACDIEAGDWLDPEGVGLTRYPNEIDPEQAIATCAAAIQIAPTAGRFHYQLGRAYQADTKYEEALAAFTKARDLGHTRAWHALGDLVAEAESIEGGAGGGAVSQKALELYAKGVEAGDPYAYHALGKQLLRHGRTKASRRHGFDLLSQALELGHTFAMNELGYYFLDEKNENFEPERGLRYLRESAARDDIYGFNNLGLVYDKGLGGTEPDPNQALEWYTKAADGGHPFAPVNIGRMYYNGRIGGGANVAEAIKWYDRGLEGGMAWGGANAAWIIANEKPRGFTPADAAMRAAKAAVLRDTEAAKQAAQVLTGLDKRAMDGASQMLLKTFDPAQEVDGVVGPKTQAAIVALSQKYNFTPPSDNALERLLTLAKVYWRDKGIRIDLL